MTQMALAGAKYSSSITTVDTPIEVGCVHGERCGRNRQVVFEP